MELLLINRLYRYKDFASIMSIFSWLYQELFVCSHDFIHILRGLLYQTKTNRIIATIGDF